MACALDYLTILTWDKEIADQRGKYTLTANSPMAQHALFATETVSFSLGVFCTTKCHINHYHKKNYYELSDKFHIRIVRKLSHTSCLAATSRNSGKRGRK